MTDFSYNFNHTSITLLEEIEGLLTEGEWINFDKEIKYGNLKESLGETFNMAHCLDNQIVFNTLLALPHLTNKILKEYTYLS